MPVFDAGCACCNRVPSVRTSVMARCTEAPSASRATTRQLNPPRD